MRVKRLTVGARVIDRSSGAKGKVAEIHEGVITVAFQTPVAGAHGDVVMYYRSKKFHVGDPDLVRVYNQDVWKSRQTHAANRRLKEAQKSGEQLTMELTHV